MRLVILGASTGPVCGVRDCALALDAPLTSAGATLETFWWERGTAPAGSARRWAREAAEAAREADAVLWHYSVFTYALHGVPALVPLVTRELGRAGVPVVGLLHELVFPWRFRGLRGDVHAAAGRLALVPLLRALAGAVVTTEERRDWLASRRWLARRPLEFVPVVSNVEPAPGPAPNGGPLTFGVFGFRREALPVDVVTQAFAQARVEVPDAQLLLIGAPGPESPEADCWRNSAAQAGCSDAVSFTGVLEREELAHVLGRLDAVVFPDPVGPTTRRGTLAAALAHGKPVVAFAGEQTWRRYVDERALLLVEQDAESLGAALAQLARDGAGRNEQGVRARDFYERHLAPAVAAPRILRFVEEVRDAR